MRLDRIVKLGQNTMRDQIDLRFLFRRELPLGFVKGLGQVRLAAQPGLSFCGPNEFENCFVTDQGLSSPVLADLRKQAMLNRIPLGSSGRIMRHSDRQSEFIRHSLQSIFPSPGAIAVGIAAVTFDQQFISVRVVSLPDLHPPASDGGHRKLRRLVRSSDDDEPLVAPHIVNPKGNGHALSMAGKVIGQHFGGLPPPRAASVFEVPNQFAFLRINADDRLASLEKAAAHPGEIAHLPVALRVLLFGQSLAVDANRVIQLPQQTANGEEADFEALAPQFPSQRAQSLAGPLGPGDRITSRGILQQLLQGFQDPWLFFQRLDGQRLFGVRGLLSHDLRAGLQPARDRWCYD